MTLLFILLVLILIIFLLEYLNPLLPKWFCSRLSWHIEPKEKYFNGEQECGNCPRCGKKITKYQKGSWY